MKRTASIFLSVVLCLFVLLPVTIHAETYSMSGTDMRISVDDTMWYVFTRDNIMNNAELDSFGLTYDDMHAILYNNEAYMDAILFSDDGNYVELFIRKRALDAEVVNLSNYDDDQVMELAEELAKKQGTEDYTVYNNRYKFARMEYYDSNYRYYICEFVTIVNKDNYTLTFQSTVPFTDWDYDEIGRIVDSIEFDVDTTMKEPKTESAFDRILEKTIIGAATGGIIGLISALIGKKKKKAKEDSQEPAVRGPEID